MVTGLEIISQIIKKTAIPFMVAVICLTIFGYFMGADIEKISSLCNINGITYDSIFQLFLLSLIIGVINTIFDLDNFMKKTLLLYKNILRITIIIAVTVFLVWYFRWFATNSIDAWLSFIIFFGICIGISITVSVYMNHKKNQEYQVLLSKFKERER